MSNILTGLSDSEISRLKHPAEDGHGHMTVFVSGVSFVWPGGEKVYVCPGGYAEPSRDSYDAPDSLFTSPAREALDILTKSAATYITKCKQVAACIPGEWSYI